MEFLNQRISVSMQMKVEPTQLRIRGAITIRDTKLRFALGYQYRQLHLLRMRVEEGALYPALHRLELRGLLASEWGVSENNRKARYYKLTPAGRKQLAAEVKSFDFLMTAIARVMEGA